MTLKRPRVGAGVMAALIGWRRHGPAIPARYHGGRQAGEERRGRRNGGDLDRRSREAVEFLPAGRARFLSEGRVELAAAARVAGRLEQGRASLELAVPPTIVFDLLVDGSRDIHAAALDGGDLSRLTEAGADGLGPTAAAGTVVFTSYGDGNADGIGAAPATADFGSGGSIEGSPSWVPSGDRLVFMSTTSGTAGLFDMPLDGERPGGAGHGRHGRRRTGLGTGEPPASLALPGRPHSATFKRRQNAVRPIE